MRHNHNPNTKAQEIARHLEHVIEWSADDNTGYLIIQVSRLTAHDLHYLADYVQPAIIYAYNDSSIHVVVDLKHDTIRQTTGHTDHTGPSSTPSYRPDYLQLESVLLYRHDICTLVRYGAAEVWPGNQDHLTIRLYTNPQKKQI